MEATAPAKAQKQPRKIGVFAVRHLNDWMDEA